MKIGCIVMAAGNARRFGSNKLDARVEGKTLLRRALEAVPAACFDRVVVVTQYPQGMDLARAGWRPWPMTASGEIPACFRPACFRS